MKIRRKLKTVKNVRKYKSMIEAAEKSETMRLLSGTTVKILYHDHENQLRTRFSLAGLGFLLFWVSVYFYCTYIVYSEDQTVLRKLYSTKLKHYGDVFERITSMIYVLYSIWKIPFDINGNPVRAQVVIDIDKDILNLGVSIDYNSIAKSMLFSSIAQAAAWFTRFFSVWLTLTNIDISMPMEVIFQGAYADALALIATVHYCYNLVVFKQRYKIVNDLLSEIQGRKSWEHKIYVRDKQPANMQRALQLQDKYICEKLKACARIYSMLYKACGTINRMFGFELTLTLTICLVYTILNLFYFMEATASGMFHDPLRYIYFLIYLTWRILYSLGMAYIIIYFSEDAVKEAANTSYVTHQIINNDLSSSIKAEAVQMSMQLLHQMPVLTACGLVQLSYPLLVEGALIVTTFLVMLLQFVTD